MVEALAWAGFVFGFVGTLLLMAERGYHEGMRAAWFIATLAVPCWLWVNFRSITLDTVSGVGFGVLVATLVRPFQGKRTRWVLADLLMVFLVATALLSDLANRKLIPGTVLDLTRMWVLPYLVGRLCVESWERMGSTLRLIVILSAILSAFAIIEAISQTNILVPLTGKKFDLLERGEGYRWGLKRAQAITNHPIYFGLLLTLTLPWLLVAARAAMRLEAPRWWIAVAVGAIAAAFATVSRSAHIAVAIVLLADLFFRRPSYRLPMLAIAIACGILFLIFREQMLDMLGAYAGEIEIGQDKVVIYGIEHDYTGTRHRDLLLLAYEEAIDKAGWTGYGTSFPSPDMPVDPFMDQRFKSIDHHYLMHFLRYGYLGSIALMALVVATAWNLAREALARDSQWSELAAGLFGGFIAVAIMIRGVAILPDFGAPWLFVAGLAASLRARRRVVR